MFLILPFINSCNNCSTCKNNLLEYKNKIPYLNGEIVIFKNDTMGLKSDTVKVVYSPPSTEVYGCAGSSDDNNKKCTGQLNVFYNNSKNGFFFDQYSNSSKNKVVFLSMCENRYTGYKKNIDTLFITYKDLKYKVIHFILLQDYNLNVTHKQEYVDESYYAIEPKCIILQYTMRDTNGVRRVWKLQ